MNEEVDHRNKVHKEMEKTRLVENYQGMSSGNLLGAFYQQLPMGRKDTIFGGVLPEEKF